MFIDLISLSVLIFYNPCHYTPNLTLFYLICSQNITLIMEGIGITRVTMDDGMEQKYQSGFKCTLETLVALTNVCTHMLAVTFVLS